MKIELNEVKQLVEKGELSKALRLLIKVVESNKFPHNVNKLKILLGQLNKSSKDYNEGVISREQKNITFSKTTKATLNQIFLIENKAIKNNNVPSVTTIMAFGGVMIVLILVLFIFGKILFIPRQEFGGPFILHSFYTFIFIVSFFIVLYYSRKEFNYSLKFFQILFGLIISSILFFKAPHISTVYIHKDSKQENANSRYRNGNWKNAMFIFLKERHKLTLESRGNIIQMQSLLKEAGYYIYDVDGHPNFNIIKSLKNLQEDHGIEPDGYFGRESRNVLYGIIYFKELNISRKINDINELNRKIIDFQKRNRLNPDGVIGGKTINALKEVTYNE